MIAINELPERECWKRLETKSLVKDDPPKMTLLERTNEGKKIISIVWALLLTVFNFQMLIFRAMSF